MTNTERTATTPDRNAGQPALPCRGCTADCRNYHRCDGRPWRTVYDGPTRN